MKINKLQDTSPENYCLNGPIITWSDQSVNSIKNKFNENVGIKHYPRNQNDSFNNYVDENLNIPFMKLDKIRNWVRFIQ